MNKNAALELALNILEPFGESSLYADYKNADAKFTDEEFSDMLETLRKLKD